MTNTQKRITVVLAGTGEFKDLAIEPGTTAQDVLNAIGHDDYRLSSSQGAPCSPTDNIFEIVTDGEKLYAAPHAEAG